MLKKRVLPMLLIVFIIFGSSVALADDGDLDADYPWRFHAPPFDFSFGNMINSHQQSSIDSNNVLHGFIYIHDTSEIAEEGIPIAEKAHCPTQDCRVGWVVKGVPITATLVSKGPRIWLVNPNDLPVEPGYTHFHWVGDPHSPQDLVIGQDYPGILMKRLAVSTFYWLGGNGKGGSGGGGCSGRSHTSSGGCSGDEGGCSGDEGGCSSEEGGCSGDEGGCSGDEGGSGGNSGHGGRLVVEGFDLHSNIITDPDEPWYGGICDD